jgi:hypothetical protein
MASGRGLMWTLQALDGCHRDFATTLVYAEYSPSEQEAEWVEEAFASPVVSDARDGVLG